MEHYAGREEYAAPPIALVAAEVRLAYEPSLNEPGVRDAFGAVVRERFPVRRLETTSTVTFQMVPGAAPATEQTTSLRALTADQTLSGRLTPTGLTVETTRYSTFDDFSDAVRYLAAVTARLLPQAVVTHVGLRYINEIRAGRDVQPGDWARYLDPRLAGPLDLLPEATLNVLSGIAVFAPEDGVTATARWASHVGTVVAVPLKRHGDTSSPAFVLDFDALQELPVAAAIDAEEVAGSLRRLHHAIGTMFAASLTVDAHRLFRDDSPAVAPGGPVQEGTGK